MGYVFSQSGEIAGKAQDVGVFYTPFGSVSGYQNFDGNVVNQAGVGVGRVVGLGYVVNAQNNLVAAQVKDFVAINNEGNRLGSINGKNIILDASYTPIGKILPDNTISEIGAGPQWKKIILSLASK